MGSGPVGKKDYGFSHTVVIVVVVALVYMDFSTSLVMLHKFIQINNKLRQQNS